VTSTRTVLYAEDDPGARLLAREAFREAGFREDLRFVEDGEELLDYLHRRGRYLDPASAPTPALVLLDLRLPRKDGREVLREIRADPGNERMPVVVLTTSNDEKEIASLYELGATSFITKPPSFAAFIEVARAIRRLIESP
jgi:CheY-like chemotaxis protein